jgi:hypothetical protein
MTEQEWLLPGPIENAIDAAQATTAMLQFLLSRGAERKLRLFACGRNRSGWVGFTGPNQRAIELAEQYADGVLPEAERLRGLQEATDEEQRERHAAEAMVEGWYSIPGENRIGEFKAAAARAALGEPALTAAVAASSDLYGWACIAGRPASIHAEDRLLLHEIFGNPFRPVAIDPAWRTPTVEALARAAYEDRQLPCGLLVDVRLAVLADALEEAGCSESSVLSHCRMPGKHVRGCFILDALLGKPA